MQYCSEPKSCRVMVVAVDMKNRGSVQVTPSSWESESQTSERSSRLNPPPVLRLWCRATIVFPSDSFSIIGGASGCTKGVGDGSDQVLPSSVLRNCHRWPSSVLANRT